MTFSTTCQRVVLCVCVLAAVVFSASAFGQTAGDRKVITLKGVEYPFRFCPAGSFTMGSPSGENDRSRSEAQHRVTLTKGFWMLETEVTQEMWESVMGSNPSKLKGKRLPVENVSWDDCQEFLQKTKFALPSEAQWEYACRAGATGAYGGSGNLDEMGWHEGNSGSKPHAVGTKKPNAWGLHDMHGNVWEWCQDWYGDYPGGSATDPVGSSDGSDRADRGGSWKYDARRSRSAYRGRMEPSRRGYDLGFRVALVSE